LHFRYILFTFGNSSVVRSKSIKKLKSRNLIIKFTEETAPNIEELKKMAATKTDANLRIEAVEELGKWKCRQSIDVLWRLMINDIVYEVQNAAFLKLQSFGEEVKLPRKSKGNLIKQIEKKIEKVLRSVDSDISYSEFLEILQKKLPEEYDVYKHEMKTKFDTWLKNIINQFLTEIRSKIKL